MASNTFERTDNVFVRKEFFIVDNKQKITQFFIINQFLQIINDSILDILKEINDFDNKTQFQISIRQQIFSQFISYDIMIKSPALSSFINNELSVYCIKQ
jgi:hypothetical protein